MEGRSSSAIIDNTIDAGITGSTVSADTGVTVSGSDTATINVGAGQVSIATSGVSVGASVAIDVISNTTDGSYRQLHGHVEVGNHPDARQLEIDHQGRGGRRRRASSLAMGGSVVYNSVTDTTQAYVEPLERLLGRRPDRVGQRHVDHQHGSGQAAVSTGYAAVGAAIIVNRISNTVTAYIGGSTVSAGGDVSVSALSNESIEAIAIGVGVSVSNKKFGLDLVGSGAGNQVTDSTEALHPGWLGHNQGHRLRERDSGRGADHGDRRGGFDRCGEEGRGIGGGGQSAAYNLIGTSGTPDPVWALIDGNSTVNAAGGVSLTATASPSISAYTLAGSGDFSTGGGGASVGSPARGPARTTRFTRVCRPRFTRATSRPGRGE